MLFSTVCKTLANKNAALPQPVVGHWQSVIQQAPCSFTVCGFSTTICFVSWLFIDMLCPVCSWLTAEELSWVFESDDRCWCPFGDWQDSVALAYACPNKANIKLIITTSCEIVRKNLSPKVINLPILTKKPALSNLSNQSAQHYKNIDYHWAL